MLTRIIGPSLSATRSQVVWKTTFIEERTCVTIKAWLRDSEQAHQNKRRKKTHGQPELQVDVLVWGLCRGKEDVLRRQKG